MVQNRPELGQKWANNVSFWGDFGPVLGRFGVTLESFQHRFGIVFASFRGRSEVVLGQFWVFWGPFRVFLRSFCGFLMVHWDFQYKNEQNEATECTNVQFAAKLTKNGQTYAKKSLFCRL